MSSAITQPKKSHSAAVWLLLAAFGLVLATLAANRWPHGEFSIDHVVYDFTESRQVDSLREAAGYLGRLGGTEILAPLGLISAIALSVIARSPRPFSAVVMAWSIAVVMVAFGKHLLERPDPQDAVGELGLSFPSGHLAQAVAMYGSLAWQAAYVIESRRIINVVRGMVIAACCLIAVCLIYRASHWLTDFIGAALVGSIGINVSRLMTPWMYSWLPPTWNYHGAVGEPGGPAGQSRGDLA